MRGKKKAKQGGKRVGREGRRKQRRNEEGVNSAATGESCAQKLGLARRQDHPGHSIWTRQHPKLIFSSLIIKIFPVPDTDSKEGYLPVPVSQLFSTAPFYLIPRTRLCAGTTTSLHYLGQELQHGGMTAS